MTSRIGRVVLWAALLAAAPAAARAQGILVTDPTIDVPSLAGSGEILLDRLAVGLSQTTTCRVFTRNDARDLARFEQLRQQLGAGESATLADDLVSVLGSDTLIAWKIGKVGGTYVVIARAFRGASAFASAQARGITVPEMIRAVGQAGADLGKQITCGGRPEVGTLTLEIVMELKQHNETVGTISDLVTTATRRDTIDVRGGFRAPVGKAEFRELSKLVTIGKESLSQCPAPGGYKDLPSSSRSDTTIDTHGGGDTEPSVDITVDGAEMHLEGLISDALKSLSEQTDVTRGVSCGKPFGPDTEKSTTDARSSAVDRAAFDVTVPFDKSLAQQSGSTSWPIEINGFKGTGTLTWKLGPAVR